VLAQEQSRQLGHGFIGTEHILLGLAKNSDTTASHVLAQLPVSFDTVRSKIIELVKVAGGAPTTSPPFTPRAKKTLELSLREALERDDEYIGTEHILLGLLREGEGMGAKILADLGVDLETAREEVAKALRWERGGKRPDGSG
jgi:ATP-dependent Clp protease ATP-binding subunit ClpC